MPLVWVQGSHGGPVASSSHNMHHIRLPPPRYSCLTKIASITSSKVLSWLMMSLSPPYLCHSRETMLSHFSKSSSLCPSLSLNTPPSGRSKMAADPDIQSFAPSTSQTGRMSLLSVAGETYSTSNCCLVRLLDTSSLKMLMFVTILICKIINLN